MTKQIIYIGNPVHLYLENEQLIVRVKETGEEVSFPIEDLGAIEIDHAQTTLTAACLRKLMEKCVSVVVTDERHMPSGLMLPMVGHTLQQKHGKAQAEATRPFHKQIWQQTVAAKINNQAAVLEMLGKRCKELEYLAKNVKSGDPQNLEGQAAKIYWNALMGSDFKRERDGEFPNALFNYAYSIIRSLVARALVSAGLHPGLGVFHRNQYNPFALADDVMEPFRPIADLWALKRYNAHPQPRELDLDDKRHFWYLPEVPVRAEDEQKRLATAVSRAATSLARFYLGETKNIVYPAPCTSILTESCG
ncbi:MAG: type II CRISPR-associated endonuclease Cas1 [Bacteroidia bacterium]|nr:type II CRISPR-associated endonuclease Cas1 [Bacteroidia bacterium]MDW8333011.1 type II CRISPR-associated endonuclease Cas1 [Bacteroidia bacterium]